MIANRKMLKLFENELIRKKKINIKNNFIFIDSMYAEASKLGVMPRKSPLDGIENDIKIARVINNVPKVTKKNSR